MLRQCCVHNRVSVLMFGGHTATHHRNRVRAIHDATCATGGHEREHDAAKLSRKRPRHPVTTKISMSRPVARIGKKKEKTILTPWIWGVTTWYQSLGIQIPWTQWAWV